MKYPISKEYFPYTLFSPPVQNAKMAGFMGSLMKPPHWIWKDKEVSVYKELIKSYDEKEIEVLIFEPCNNSEVDSCLVYYHGGGFFFGAAGYHYRLAKKYVLDTPCKLVFVQYRLAPKNPHPTPSEDCYVALEWTFENAERLKVSKNKIAVAGDSAGGALAAAVCQMARDRKTKMPLFQLLIYPVTDRRMITDSCKKYTNTPMWNSKLSKKMWQGYVQDENATNIAFASPMDADSFDKLPPAYLETAEFDCLHDEGIAYGKALENSGVKVYINETKGTMHGFDIVKKAPTTVSAVEKRIEFMKNAFKNREVMEKK